jgi:hypothetical protein
MQSAPDDDSQEKLASRVDKALRYDDEHSSETKIDDSGLHEDFDFFIASADADASAAREKELTPEDCRALYRKLRAQIDSVIRQRDELQVRLSLFEQEKKDFYASQQASSEEWKAKYAALKKKYDALKTRSREAPSPTVSEPETPSARKPRKKSAKHVRPSPSARRPSPIREAPAPKREKPQSKQRRSSSPKTFSRFYPLSDRYPLDFTFNPGPIVRQETLSRTQRKATVRYRNGITGTIFANGTRTIRNGTHTYTYHLNGDIAIDFDDGAHAYRYFENQTVELLLPNGTKLFLFANGQREKYFPNGDKEIVFPDGKTKKIQSGGEVHE